MTDNTALARFITSLGSLNGYGSTVAQTKKALDLNSTEPLRQNEDDIAIFQDAVKGIKAAEQVGFTVDGIIAINTEFDSPSDEEPQWPGHLRNAMYNEDDRISVVTDPHGHDAYFPPEIVTRADLQRVVDQYEVSAHTERDAWQVFATLAKLQPFQDGNKRTALIAANEAYGTLATGNYLALPFNDLDRAEFTIQLMRFYGSSKDDEAQYLDNMMRLLPSDREKELNRPIEENRDLKGQGSKKNLKTRIKPQFRNPSRER
ncbi:Fic family protein [Furfurilactobacillus entadae]|uniref:Fic family protein n=1 Tax=Furfurilactobacillus entadae TaxID=2922307 RepID=UPI0035E569F8